MLIALGWAKTHSLDELVGQDLSIELIMGIIGVAGQDTGMSLACLNFLVRKSLAKSPQAHVHLQAVEAVEMLSTTDTKSICFRLRNPRAKDWLHKKMSSYLLKAHKNLILKPS